MGTVTNLDLKKVRLLTQQELAEMGTIILTHTIGEVQELAASTLNKDFLRAWMARLVWQSYLYSDADSFSKIMDRIVGKPKERIEVTDHRGNTSLSRFTLMSKEEKMAEIKRLQEINEMIGDD